MAGGQQVGITAAIALECGAIGVVGVAVDLDDEPPAPPQEVDLVAGDADVRLGHGEPCGADQAEQAPLGLRAREARLTQRVEGVA
jgi:hypothetical protein